MKTAKHSICLLTASLVATATVHAGSYIITSTNKSEVVGTTAAVAGSGSSANFTSGTVTVGSTFASFQLEDGSGTRNADLIVTLTGV
ncbi:MAG: hypothetical protein KJO21_12815, partial [Verrucomicrobiae bacterium]|nr:hypothetical protein [Verrucomicrobiae bacterium]